MTQEQVKLVRYALDFLKINLNHDNCQILRMGNFGEVWGKIDKTEKCFELLVERGQLK
jgi:hypothetical protein